MSSVDTSNNIISRMTSHVGEIKSTQGGFREKLFRPQTLDAEQIILHMVDAISLSALMVKDVGNAGEANAVFCALAQNLDNFVYPLLTSEESINWDEYIAKRKKIIDEWTSEQMSSDSPISAARKLYTLTLKTLFEQRLFKVRRMVYFGVGWKKAKTAGITEDKKRYEALNDGDANIPITLMSHEEDEELG